MEKRRLGRTEHMSSMVIFGGAALGNSAQEEAYEALELCLEAGINHIDIAPSYGHAEALVGPWLQGHRDKFFLACKTGERTYDKAKISKIQKQFSSDKWSDEEVIRKALNDNMGDVVKYEMEVNVKADGKWKLLEVLFSSEGAFISQREITKRSAEFILY